MDKFTEKYRRVSYKLTRLSFSSRLVELKLNQSESDLEIHAYSMSVESFWLDFLTFGFRSSWAQFQACFVVQEILYLHRMVSQLSMQSLQGTSQA